MGKTTDELERLSRDVSTGRHGREMDLLLSSGERISMALLTMALHDLGVDAVSFTGSQAGIVTDTNHERAKILEIRATGSARRSAAGRVVVIAGFQGVSIEKDVTTLGRGGSDTTAVALAARARRRPLRDLHRRLGRVHRRPSDRSDGPPDPPLVVGGAARDVRRRLPQAGGPSGGVRPYASRAVGGALVVHMGARARELARRRARWNRPSCPPSCRSSAKRRSP